MDPARWNQIEELLQSALDLEPGQRAAFLASACGGDDDLRREVESLLAQEPNSALSQHPLIERLRMPALFAGQQVSHYRIEERIGAGGMGEVYQARDDSLQRTVALKVLPPEFVDDPDRVRRFEQEALSASRLNHPNIVTIFEILESEGLRFIVTERIDGQTLREVLEETLKLEVQKALDIAIQIAAALKAAHTAWIIHRDIKPENVMVRDDGLVKVLDFGIAKLSEEPESTGPAVTPDDRANLTVPGSILGTARYMSPEQARGEPLDGRTDLYSLGLVLHEMVTGQRPGALAERGRIEHVPREIERIIRKLLRPDRDARYSSASDLLDDLHRAKRRIESRTARRMVGLGVLAVVVALLVAGIAAFLSVNERWEERVLRDGHTAAARSAVFSPDGSQVVSCGEDGQVIVWSFARRERIAMLNHPSHKVVFAPNGRWLATGGIDGAVVIWDAKQWTPLRRLPIGKGDVGALAFSSDSERLAASTTFLATSWRTEDWRKVGEWRDGGSNHGTFLLPAGHDHVLTSHLVVMDMDARSRGLGDPLVSTNWVSLSPDGTTVAGIDTAGKVWFHRLPVRGDFHRLEVISSHRAHQDHGRGIAYSPDGQLVASAADDILLWDAATRRKVARFEYPSIVWSVAFSPDGRWLVSAHGDGAVLVWDVAERERVASFNEHSGGVRAVAFSPDGKRVVSGSEDRTVTIWNLDTGRKEAVFGSHATRVMGVAFAKGGAEVASIDQGSVLKLWNVAKREAVATMTRSGLNHGYCLTVSPDSRYFASTSAMWDRDGRLLLDFVKQSTGQAYGMDFSPDGQTLATVWTTGEVMVWDARTFRRLAVHSARDTRQITVSFSHDGKFLATGEDQGAIRLWSVDPLREIAILGRHRARVKSVAFSPDGKTVASAGDDKMIALWDVRRRELRTRIGTHVSPVYAVAFSPDGKQLVSGEHDRSVRVYTRRRTVWGIGLE